MKKKVILVIGIIVAIAVITVISLYVANEDVRDWMDEYIFRKNIVDENLPTISIENENASIYAYDNHIVILKDNKLTISNSKLNLVTMFENYKYLTENNFDLFSFVNELGFVILKYFNISLAIA